MVVDIETAARMALTRMIEEVKKVEARVGVEIGRIRAPTKGFTSQVI